jgi:hypothetical protein
VFVLYNDPPKREKDYILLAVLVGLAAFGFGYMVYKLRHRPGKRVIVCSGGLACVEGGRTLVCLWPEVRSIKEALVDFYVNGLYRHTDRFITMEDRDGTVIEFGGAPKEVDEVADAVVDHAYEVITPRLLERLARRKSVRVGPLTVSETGVESEQGKLFWADLKAVKVEKGELVVLERGRRAPWFKCPLGDIENYRVLLTLLEQRGAPD